MAKAFLQRLRAKEYAGSWKNPLFADPHLQTRSSERLRFVFLTLLIGAAGGACLSLLFWFAVQDKFAITEVRAEGMRSVPNERVAQKALSELLSCSYFGAPCLYTWNNAKANLALAFEREYTLEELERSVENGELLLRVREAVTFMPLKIENAIWFATQGGVLQKEATAEEISAGVLIPPEVYQEIDVSAVVKDTPTAGMQILSSEAFAQIRAYEQAFREKGIAIATFVLTKDMGKVEARTAQGFAIFFTPWENAEVQVRRLNEVLQRTSPEEYVDIRFGERIYVK